jgi:hypothetical protein
MEKILKIEEVVLGCESGFEITTDKQVIKLLIDNYQSCCENWGYFMSEDILEFYIGAEIIDISLTDTALNTEKLTDVYEGGIMFVNILTTKGMLQFVAYNEHNGYYGHEARVISEQLNHKEYL